MSNKAIVETSGSHMYIDPTNGTIVDEGRPSVVAVTPFISQKIADGMIKLLTPNLPKQASDKDFAAIYESFKDSENGVNAAVAQYASEFGLDETGNPVGSKPQIGKKAEKVKVDNVKTDEVKTDEVKTDEVKTDEVKTDEVKTDEVKVSKQSFKNLLNK